jgi:hypothetical protein
MGPFQFDQFFNRARQNRGAARGTFRFKVENLVLHYRIPSKIVLFGFHIHPLTTPVAEWAKGITHLPLRSFTPVELRNTFASRAASRTRSRLYVLKAIRRCGCFSKTNFTVELFATRSTSLTPGGIDNANK